MGKVLMIEIIITALFNCEFFSFNEYNCWTSRASFKRHKLFPHLMQKYLRF